MTDDNPLFEPIMMLSAGYFPTMAWIKILKYDIVFNKSQGQSNRSLSGSLQMYTRSGSESYMVPSAISGTVSGFDYILYLSWSLGTY